MYHTLCNDWGFGSNQLTTRRLAKLGRVVFLPPISLLSDLTVSEWIVFSNWLFTVGWEQGFSNQTPGVVTPPGYQAPQVIVVPRHPCGSSFLSRWTIGFFV